MTAKIIKSRAGLPRLIICFLLVLCTPSIMPFARAAELQPHTVAAWDKYIRLTEQRIESGLRNAATASNFLMIDVAAKNVRDKLRRGEIHIQKLQTRERDREIEVQDGMIHHWMGAIFISGAKLDALLRWVKDYARHDQFFREIEQSRLISHDGDTYKFYYRL